MRGGILAVGVILVILGIVILYVPLASMGSGSVSVGSGMTFQTSGTYFSQSLAVSWTSPSPMTITIMSCSSVDPVTHDCSNPSVITTMIGTSGTYTFTAGSGQYYQITALGIGTASITTKGTIPTLGYILIVIGAIVALLGVILRSPKAAAAGAANPKAPVPPT
jgi:hypothetical protein